VIETCIKKVWAPVSSGPDKSSQRQAQRVFVDALMTLGASAASPPDVKAVVIAEAGTLRTKIAELKDPDAVNEAHLRQIERELGRYLQNPTVPRNSAPPAPVMAPI
jgi:hypothetical protein